MSPEQFVEAHYRVWELYRLVKAARYHYQPDAPADRTGWEPPTPKRKSWRWDTHNGPVPKVAKAPKGRRKKGEAPPPAVASLPPERDETLVWYKDSPGVKAGSVIQHGSKWVVVVSAKQARSRRVSSQDEDAGWGQEGGRLTQQAVRLRDALPHEVAAEEKRRADKAAAAEAERLKGDPLHQADQWATANQAAPLSYEEAQKLPPITWTRHTTKPAINIAGGGATFDVGVDEGGTVYGRYATSNYDDHRESVWRGPQTEATKQWHAQQAGHLDLARGVLDRIAETGTYTDDDLAHLTPDVQRDLRANEWERESPTKLRRGADGQVIVTPDGRRAALLSSVRANHVGPLEGLHDVAFEALAGKALNTLGSPSPVTSWVANALEAMRSIEVPPAYAGLVAQRMQRGTDYLAAHQARELEAARERAEAERAKAEARASARSSRGSSSRSASASFAKLRDGSWGVRVDGDADEGDRLTVRRRDGSKEAKTLGRLVHDGGDYKLFRLAKALTPVEAFGLLADDVVQLARTVKRDAPGGRAGASAPGSSDASTPSPRRSRPS